MKAKTKTDEDLLDPTRLLAVALANYRWDSAHISLRAKVKSLIEPGTPWPVRAVEILASRQARKIVGTATDGNGDVADEAVKILTRRILGEEEAQP